MNKRTPGFTLVELLVVAVVSAVMLAAIFQTLVVQQRSYRDQNAIIGARQTTRASLELLAAELREMSATDGDLVLAARDSVTFRAYRKLGIVCVNDMGNSRLIVWQLGTPFASGDSVMLFLDGDTLTSQDDVWARRQINNVGSANCPEAWDGAQSALIQGSGMSVSAVYPGAPVRAFEHLTYGRYLIDGEWVVGRHAPGSPAVALIGPVTEGDGLQFRYFDANGVELGPLPLSASQREQVARIEVTVRGRALGAANPGDPERLETLVTQVALRGNVWN